MKRIINGKKYDTETTAEMRTFTVLRMMSSDPETTIDVDVWHGTFPDTPDEAVWRVCYWSDFGGRSVTRDFGHDPTESDVCALLADSERCDDAWEGVD